MNKYVLDTSALLAYIDEEEGAEEIEGLFKLALEDKAEIFISVISSIEVFYISWQEQGKEFAKERLKLIEDLPLIQESLGREITQFIGKIKATKSMSFADSCIAGLSKLKKAILVHKDPEFDQIENEIKQLKLPYKQKSKHN